MTIKLRQQLQFINKDNVYLATSFHVYIICLLDVFRTFETTMNLQIIQFSLVLIQINQVELN